MSRQQEFTPLPDISGIGYITEKPRNMLYLSRLIKRARYAELLPENKRTTNDNMDMVAWNLTWRCFKRSRPALAALIQDPIVKEIMEAFDGELNIEL